MITKLQIKNFLGISEVEITPDNKLNIITGKNGQGKTSILKAIEFAFKGKLEKGAEIVNIDASKAEVYIDLDKFSVSRTKAYRVNEIQVKNEEGFVMPKPQDFLNELVGDFSFNPIEFTFLNEKDKTKYLLKILNIELTKKDIEESTHLPVELDTDTGGLPLLDEAIQFYYDERAFKNREVKNKEGALKEFSCHNKDVDQIALRKFNPEKLAEKREKISDARVEYEQAQNNNEKVSNTVIDIKLLEEKLENLKNDHKEMKVISLDKIKEKGEKLKAEVEQMELVEQEFTDFKNYQKIEVEKNQMIDEAKELDDAVKLLQNDFKNDIMSRAEMPVKNLSYEDGKFMVDGKPITNLSDSEKLNISMAIAKRLNKKFGIICIDGAEKLDKDSFDNLKKEVKKGEFQFFITNVHSEEGIVMEGGKVKK